MRKTLLIQLLLGPKELAEVKQAQLSALRYCAESSNKRNVEIAGLRAQRSWYSYVFALCLNTTFNLHPK